MCHISAPSYHPLHIVSMTRKALVTGATGLLGRQVLSAFQSPDWTVVGTGFTRSTDSTRKLDLADSSAISALLDEVKYESRPLRLVED